MSRPGGRLCAAVACALLACASSASAAQPVDIGPGSQAAVAVDQSGTAYIAFNAIGAPFANQDLHVCRLPRGAAACASVATLPTTGLGATSSGTRPFVSVSGATVRVLSYRSGYTIDATNDDVLFTSTDGGVSFGAGVKVGTLRPDGDSAAGPGGGISLVNTASASHAYQRVPTDGSGAVSATAALSTQYVLGGAVALLNDTTPVVAFHDNTNAAFSRYTAGAVNSSASWSAAQVIGPAVYERLAGGPTGLFAMLATGGHLEVRRFDGSTFGAPTAIPGSDSNRLTASDLFQDPAGRLQALWPDASGTLFQSTSDDGVHWATQALATFADVREMRGAAAADHGGVAAWTAGTGDTAKVYAAALAPPPGSAAGAPEPGAGPPASPAALSTPPAHAEFTLSATRVPRGGPISFDASKSVAGGAIARQYAWDVNDDGRTDASCDGTTPVLTTRLPASGASAVKLTVTDVEQRTSSALQPLTVTSARVRPRARAASFRVPVGLSYRCKSPTAVTQDITAQGGPPAGCVGQVSFGIVDAEGCLDAAPHAQDIPIAERNVILGIFTTLADSRAGSAAAAAAPAGKLAATDRALATRDPVISRQSVRVNGLDITPAAGAVVAIVPSDYSLAGREAKTGYIVSSKATIKVGSVTLQSGRIRVELPFGTRTAHVFDFDLKRDVPFLKDLPLTGGVEGDLVDQATLLPAHVMLPGVFTDPSTGKGLSAEVTLKATNPDGIVLDGLEVRAPHVFLGGIALNDLFFRYRRADETYEGGGQVVFPPQGDSITGSIGFQNGGFKYLRLAYDAGPSSTGIVIGPGVSMLHLAGAFQLRPTELYADTVIGMGVASGRGCPAVGVRASLNQHFYPPPYVLDARGSVELNCLPLSHGFLHIDGNGYVSFGGALDYDFVAFSLKAEVTAQYMDPHFQVDGNARGCLGDLGCIGGELVISDKGMGFCADFGFTHAGAGFFYPPVATLANPATAIAGILGNTTVMLTSCNVGQFRTLPQIAARAAQAGGSRSFQVTDPKNALVMGVKGSDGVPQVKLTGPGGRVVQAPADRSVRGADAVVFHNPGDQTEYFLVDKPARGTWTLETLDGSPAVADVRLAQALADPQVTGVLHRRGGSYELRYRWKRAPGQAVRFVEHAPGGERVLGTATAARGTLRFTPSDASGTARRVIAQVSLDGRPQANIDLAGFTAAPSRLAAPRGVRIRRAGKGARVTWKAVAGATGYLVSARIDDGRVLVVPVRGRRRVATITPVARRAAIVVHVSALRRGGQPAAHSRDVRLARRR